MSPTNIYYGFRVKIMIYGSDHSFSKIFNDFLCLTFIGYNFFSPMTFNAFVFRKCGEVFEPCQYLSYFFCGVKLSKKIKSNSKSNQRNPIPSGFNLMSVTVTSGFFFLILQVFKLLLTLEHNYTLFMFIFLFIFCYIFKLLTGLNEHEQNCENSHKKRIWNDNDFCWKILFSCAETQFSRKI